MKQFRDGHGHIRSVLDDYPAFSGNWQKPSIPEILQQRKAFSVAFHAHFSALESALARFDDGAQGGLSNLLVDYRRRMRELVIRHSTLVRNWSPKLIETEWPDYCRAVREQRDFLLAHFAWEEREVFPAMERAANDRQASQLRA